MVPYYCAVRDKNVTQIIKAPMNFVTYAHIITVCTYMLLYTELCMCMYIYIYIYRGERERERERDGEMERWRDGDGDRYGLRGDRFQQPYFCVILMLVVEVCIVSITIP